MTPPAARILLRAHKDPFTVAGARATLDRNLLGGNAGNLVFGQAAFRLLSVPDTTLTTSMLRELSAAQINDDYDHLVIPLANAFRASFLDQLSWLTGLIEGLQIPVTVLGVGAQAKLSGRYAEADAVDALARRFVRAVLRRGPSIGVRGERSAEYLRSLGFGDDEVSVIGCPSLFTYGPHLPRLRRVESLTADSPIALTVSPYVSRMGPITQAAAQRYPRLVYLGQNQETLELLLTGHYPLPRGARQRTTGVPLDRKHPLLASGRTRFCIDPQTWYAELARYDFCFGTRIHGSIAALLAGTPAVLLAHDTRTLELAEYHEIPFRPVPAKPELADPSRLYARADWTNLHRGHPTRWQTFTRYLSAHGLAHVYGAGGDHGAAFDARLAGTPFPPPIRPLTGRLAGPRYATRRLVSLPIKAIHRLPHDLG